MCVLFRSLPEAGAAVFMPLVPRLAAHLDTRTEVVVTTGRDALGSGFALLPLNECLVQPAGGGP